MSQQPYQPPYPQQPYQQAPQGQPQPVYNQPPPQGAPSPFNQAAPSGPPAPGGWSNPDAPQGGGGEAPAFHQLSGRLVFIKPTTSIKDSPKNARFVKPGEATTEHLVTAEVVVCDGEPIVGNLDGNTHQLTPFSAGPRQIPAYFKQIYIRGAVIPGQLHRFAGGANGGIVAGRIVVGTASGTGKPPFVLNDPTEQDNQILNQVFPMWEQLVAQAQGQLQQAGPPVQGGQVYPPPGYAQAPGQPYPGQPYQQPQQGTFQPTYGTPPQAPQQPQYAPEQGAPVQQPAPQGQWPQQGPPYPTH